MLKTILAYIEIMHGMEKQIRTRFETILDEILSIVDRASIVHVYPDIRLGLREIALGRVRLLAILPLTMRPESSTEHETGEYKQETGEQNTQYIFHGNTSSDVSRLS
jgi:hypothetical protein